MRYAHACWLLQQIIAATLGFAVGGEHGYGLGILTWIVIGLLADIRFGLWK